MNGSGNNIYYWIESPLVETTQNRMKRTRNGTKWMKRTRNGKKRASQQKMRYERSIQSCVGKFLITPPRQVTKNKNCINLPCSDDVELKLHILAQETDCRSCDYFALAGNRGARQLERFEGEGDLQCRGETKNTRG